MLFESAHVRVSAEYGIATLWLAFPGDPVNAWTSDRLRELEAALGAIESNPFINVLVVRSALPAGFCAGIHPAALASLTTASERAQFAWHGQRVFERLAKLPFTTLAFIDGPCLGAGLELALACDYRLCVARLTTHLGLQPGVPPCFGGSARLTRLKNRTLSGREAQRLGLVDDAFCERRAKIELRTFLDGLERRGAVSPPRKQGSSSLAIERRTFAQARFPDPPQSLVIDPQPINPIPALPPIIGLIGENEFASRIVADAVLRGGRAVVSGSRCDVENWIALSQARGFVTPLEAEQTLARICDEGLDLAGLVFLANDQLQPAHRLSPTAIIVVCDDFIPVHIPHPRRLIGVTFTDACAELIRFPHTDSDTVAALAAWLTPFGFHCTLADRIAHSTRLAA